MPLATSIAGSYHTLIAHAYTYALVHTPTKRVYMGCTTDVRKTINMWNMRLRNPNGNPGVPVPMKSFTWEPNDWFFKLGRAYETEGDARHALFLAVRAKPEGITILNTTVRKATIAQPTKHRHERAIVWPQPMPYEAMRYEWPDFLRWIMALPANHLGNPTDAQVKEAWQIWHGHHGTMPVGPVPDPDRDDRRRRAARNRRYQQAHRARKRANQHG